MALVFLSTLLYRADVELGGMIVEKLRKADYDVSTSEGSESSILAIRDTFVTRIFIR